MICPVCGAMLVQPGQSSFLRDKELRIPEEKVLSGCLCWTELEALEQAYQSVRESLASIIKDRFAGSNWDELMEEVMKLPKQAPLREHILYKRRMLDRARETIEKKRAAQQQQAQAERHKKQAREKGIEGREVRLREFLDSFGE